MRSEVWRKGGDGDAITRPKLGAGKLQLWAIMDLTAMNVLVRVLGEHALTSPSVNT